MGAYLENLGDYLSELKNKYSYNDDMLKAIEITIKLMVEKYGIEQIVDICSLFAGTEVFALRQVNRENVMAIEKKLKKSYPHVQFVEDENQYGTNQYGSSLYSATPIFDRDMKVIGETRYIVVKDMAGSPKEEGYRRLFGTSINIPNFIHEANHAYAMMHPEYTYDENKITSKHGMYTTTFNYTQSKDGKYLVIETGNDDVVLEDIINENITQDMLISFFKKENYGEVKEVLKSIYHVGNKYSDLLMTLARKFERLLGSQNLMEYRRNNDVTPILEFNELAKQSDIAIEYLNGVDPFEYFKQKVFEIFNLTSDISKFDPKNYGKDSSRLMIEAFAPLMSYQEIKRHTINLEKFNETRDSVLSEYVPNQGNELNS